MDIKDMRHSLAHVMVLAIRRLYEDNILRGVGPAIETGFYQDFDYSFSQDDLPKIESEMKKIIDQDFEFIKEEATIDEALKYYKSLKQIYKLELLEDIKSKGTSKVKDEEEDIETSSLAQKGIVKFYTIDTHKDLCRGGHVKRTGELKNISFKIDRVAGAYWRGSEKNKMLVRIYGVAFADQKEFDKYYERIEEAKRRDHRVVGKEQKIYTFSELVGPGLPLYLPNGGIIVGEIEKYLKNLQTKLGYNHVYTPHIAQEGMYQTSGHLQWYKDSMFAPMEFEGANYYLKPMSCPHHIQLYKFDKRSYRELPLKLAEFGNVYRYEKSGELGGLLRTRGFTQDDAHIFCTNEQVVDVFTEVIDLLNNLLDGLGLKDRRYSLSLRDETKDKYAGNIEQWENATKYIKKALEIKNIKYFEAKGEAAFYGPKLDVLFKDSLDREWQISTVQVDFLQPQRFNLEYIDHEGKVQQPFMIHRAPLGSRERIMAILLEHYVGSFPTWLSPLQVKIVPINEKNIEYAKQIEQLIKQEGDQYDLYIRCETDVRNENLQKKIADASQLKSPYIVIVGKKEEENKTISLRVRGKGDVGTIDPKEFATNLLNEIRSRSITTHY